MKLYLKSAAAAALAVLMSGSPSVSLAQSGGLKMGVLSCTVEGGFGLLLGSSRDAKCSFEPANKSGPVEFYTGTINKLGIDIGITGKSYLKWLVFSAENYRHEPGGLGGVYTGASASASFAAGLGANALLGGNRNSVALQPFSVQGQTGLNLAVGVARLRLRPAG